MTVAELGHRMDADELGWWLAFESLEQNAAALQDLAGTVERQLIQAHQE